MRGRCKSLHTNTLRSGTVNAYAYSKFHAIPNTIIIERIIIMSIPTII